MSQTKKHQSQKASVFPRKTLDCVSGPSDEEKGRAFATLLNSPELAAYRIVSMMQPHLFSKEIDLPTLIEILKNEAIAAQGGDMSRAEAMLANQASALQALFVRLAERAMEQTHLPNMEGLMKLALRAQSQCRATLETLSVIKNPPVVYAKQANVTTGPQQINNGVSAPLRAREEKNAPNQLSGGLCELSQNTRAPSLKSQANTPLETLGKIDWTENC